MLPVKPLPIHLRHVAIVLWEKRVPLVLIVLRRVLLVKLHPVVRTRVPIVLPVKRRLKRQHPVVQIAVWVKLLSIHFRLVPIALPEHNKPPQVKPPAVLVLLVNGPMQRLLLPALVALFVLLANRTSVRLRPATLAMEGSFKIKPVLHFQ